MRLSNILASLTFSGILFFSLGLTFDNVTIVTSEGTDQCKFASSSYCMHNFDSTTDATTGDSLAYLVAACNKISYQHFAAGGSTMQVMQCPSPTKDGSCTIFAPDSDSDGRITLADEGVILDGTVGRRALVGMTPSAPYQYVNVLNPPSSGIATVSILCEK